MTLEEIADTLMLAQRLGADTDEPEGSRFIQISDTLAKRMAKAIDDQLVDLDYRRD